MEIGCEELPADYLPAVMDTAVLSEAGVKWKEALTYATPRRLVLHLKGVEPVVKKKEKGPPAQVAFDAQGQPTRAAEAFAQRHGLKLSQLAREQTPKGEVLFAKYDLPVAKILAEKASQIIEGIRFPKTMRWDSSGVRFARPVRWLLCLYGPNVVRCHFGGTASGNVTFAGRADARKKITIAGPSAYFTALRKAGVQLEDGKQVKREALRKKLEAAAGKLGGRLPDETTEEFDWLLNTVTFLAEDPVVAAGSFRPEYLELPPEVLQTSMAKHLKLFSIRSATSDKLLPKFLAVLEGKPKSAAGVMANYERIIEARFTDARFFYKEDTKTRLEAKVPQLEKVAFHEKLGTVGQRIPRLEKIAGSVALMAGIPVEGISRTIRLAKADLVTQMVREFPSLQGTIGGHYARADGEPAEVVAAIAQQYWPRAAKDPVPTTPLAALVGLADRLDTLSGYFKAGLKPTGSADPYGLRRQALGLVRILIEPPKGVSFVGLSFDRLFDESIQSELRVFLRERFEWLATEAAPSPLPRKCRSAGAARPIREAPADDRGGTVPAAEEVPQRGCAAARELVAAVLAAGDEDLAGAWERLQLLRRLWAGSGDGKRKTLEAAAKVAERTGRIVKSVKDLPLPDTIDPAILKEPEEKELWETWNRIAPQVKEHLERRQYEEATKIYSALYPAVHSYFEKVFVMAEDEGLRRNRLALLKQIHGSLALSFADLSRLPLPGALEN